MIPDDFRDAWNRAKDEERFRLVEELMNRHEHAQDLYLAGWVQDVLGRLPNSNARIVSDLPPSGRGVAGGRWKSDVPNEPRPPRIMGATVAQWVAQAAELEDGEWIQIANHTGLGASRTAQLRAGGLEVRFVAQPPHRGAYIRLAQTREEI